LLREPLQAGLVLGVVEPELELDFCGQVLQRTCLFGRTAPGVKALTELRAPADPVAPPTRTYRGVATADAAPLFWLRRQFVRGPDRAVDHGRAHWYGRALVSLEAPTASDSIPDEALVRSVAGGDTGALAALYDRHAPLMLALARRIVAGKPEAEDIVHDVFVEAWRRAADYDEARGSVKAWLLLRTRSRALDFKKSAAISRTVPTGDSAWLATLMEPRADGSEAPDRARLRRMLGALSVEHREVLVLGYFEGMSSSEIADTVGIPIGTVKSRVAAALSALRQALADRGGAP